MTSRLESDWVAGVKAADWRRVRATRPAPSGRRRTERVAARPLTASARRPAMIRRSTSNHHVGLVSPSGHSRRYQPVATEPPSRAYYLIALPRPNAFVGATRRPAGPQFSTIAAGIGTCARLLRATRSSLANDRRRSPGVLPAARLTSARWRRRSSLAQRRSVHHYCRFAGCRVLSRSAADRHYSTKARRYAHKAAGRRLARAGLAVVRQRYATIRGYEADAPAFTPATRLDASGADRAWRRPLPRRRRIWRCRYSPRRGRAGGSAFSHGRAVSDLRPRETTLIPTCPRGFQISQSRPRVVQGGNGRVLRRRGGASRPADPRPRRTLRRRRWRWRAGGLTPIQPREMLIKQRRSSVEAVSMKVLTRRRWLDIATATAKRSRDATSEGRNKNSEQAKATTTRRRSTAEDGGRVLGTCLIRVTTYFGRRSRRRPIYYRYFD